MFDILYTILVFNEVKGCVCFLADRMAEGEISTQKNIICFSQHNRFVFKSEPFIIFILALLKAGGRVYSGSWIYLQACSGVL